MMDKYVVKEKKKIQNWLTIYLQEIEKEIRYSECFSGVIFQLNCVSLTFRRDTIAFLILDPQKQRKT